MMNPVRRNIFEIVRDLLVLTDLQHGICSTRISQKANLPPKTGKDIIEDLLKKGFLEAVPKKRKRGAQKYRTTQKGREYVIMFESLESFLKE